MNDLLYTGFILFIFASFPYLIYLYLISRNIHQKVPNQITLPITIILAAFNESVNLKRTIDSISATGYPDDCINLIIIDDQSTDATNDVAKSMVSLYKFASFRVIRNEIRAGPAESYNRGMALSTTEIVVTMDADVTVGRFALTNLINRLMSDPDIAAACGDLMPDYREEKRSIEVERGYRSMYGKMCEVESYYDSTFNFNGALVAFRKSLVGAIKTGHGADDANTAFTAIENGYRAVYEPDAKVYESVKSTFSAQMTQKRRRAVGLLQSIAMHATRLGLVIRQRRFAFVGFFTMRFIMYFLSPFLFLIGGILIFLHFFVYDIKWIIFGAIATIVILELVDVPNTYRNIFVAFVMNQIYLIAGLLSVAKNVEKW